MPGLGKEYLCILINVEWYTLLLRQLFIILQERCKDIVGRSWRIQGSIIEAEARHEKRIIPLLSIFDTDDVTRIAAA